MTQSAFTTAAYNKTQGKDVTVTLDPTEGFIVNTSTTANFKKDDVVTVTIIHNASGLKVTKELKVDDKANIAELSVGEVVLPTGKTVLTADLKNLKAPITAKDQFGMDIKPANADITVISSDDLVLASSDVKVSNDGKNLEIAKFGKAGNVKLTLLANKSGTTATVSLDVQEAPGTITSVVLEETAGVIAADSTKAIKLEVKDNYGTEIKVSEYRNKLSFSSTNTAVVSSSGVEINSKGELEITTLANATKGNKTTITILVDGKALATYVVTAGEKAVPTSVDVDSTSKHSTKLVVGATTDVKFTAFDQYGSKVGSNNADYSVKYTVKNDATDIIGINKPTDANEQDNTLTVTAKAAGTATVMIELIKDGQSVASKEVAFEVSANTAEGLSIADIAKLAPTAGQDPSSIYREEVKVVTADGAVVPSASILEVVSSYTDIATVHKVGQKYYVVGNAADVNAAGNAIDGKATITVVYNATDKPVTLTKEVTVSTTTIANKAVNVVDKPLKDNKLDKTAVAVTSRTVETFADVENLDIYALIEDNYDRNLPAKTTDSDINSVKIEVKDAKGYNEAKNTITLDAQGKLVFTDFEENLITEEGTKASFRVLITTKTGSKIGYVDITVNGGETVAEAAQAALISKINAGNADETEFASAGITDVTAGNLSDVKATVAAAKVANSGNNLDKAQIQTAVDNTIAVIEEAAKYETAATVAKAIEAETDIDATIVKLKSDKEAVEGATISNRTPADGTQLKVDTDKFVLKAQKSDAGDATEEATFDIEIGNATKTVTVNVTIKSQI